MLKQGSPLDAQRPGLSLALTGDVDAPVRARAALGALAGDVSSEQLAMLNFVISELVTNSVVHGEATHVTVRITVGDRTLHGAVSDSGPGFEPSDPPVRRAIGGLGLVIVDLATTRWGTSHNGRRVWFELDRGLDADAPGDREIADAGDRDDALCAQLQTADAPPPAYEQCRAALDVMIGGGVSSDHIEQALTTFAISSDERSALWLWAATARDAPRACRRFTSATSISALIHDKP